MYLLKLHPNFTVQRWSHYLLQQQILMIGNEVNRLKNGIVAGQDLATLRETMERAFELVDLTVACGSSSLRRELLRWRDLFAELYLMDYSTVRQHRARVEALYRVLLEMNSNAAAVLN